MKLEIRIISVSHKISKEGGTFYIELEYNHCNDTHYVEITYSTFIKLRYQTFPLLLKVVEL